MIKVEHAVRGDAMRGLAKSGVMNLDGAVHVLNEHSNRGKRSIGIDIDDLRAQNPRIIYARGTSFGVRGPDANRGGYDMTSFWCRAGNAGSATPVELEGALQQPGPAWGDSVSGMFMAGGISTALLKLERTGEPSVVDVSLLSSGGWALSAGIALALQQDSAWTTPMPGKPMGSNSLVGIHRTRDDRYISLVMLQAAYYWSDFCQHIDRPDLIEDDRFETSQKLTSNSEVAIAIIAGELSKKTLAEWTERFQTLKGQWAPVQNTLDFPLDSQVRANGYVARTTTREGVEFDLVAPPVQFDETPTPTRRAPEFNEHGDEILQEIGLDMDRIIELRMRGAIT